MIWMDYQWETKDPFDPVLMEKERVQRGMAEDEESIGEDSEKMDEQEDEKGQSGEDESDHQDEEQSEEEQSHEEDEDGAGAGAGAGGMVGMSMGKHSRCDDSGPSSESHFVSPRESP